MRKREGRSPFLKGCQAGFSDLPLQLPGLGTNTVVVAPMAGLAYYNAFHHMADKYTNYVTRDIAIISFSYKLHFHNILRFSLVPSYLHI